MRRREFITVFAVIIPGARLLCPAHAQTSGIRRIALQLRSCLASESMGHDDSEIMDGERVG
jgi:putative ABC transport system substrate-binding protein